LKWTLLVQATFESQAVVKVANQPVPKAAAFAGLESLSEKARDQAASSVQGIRVNADHFAFVCRAASALSANQVCGALVASALGSKFARGVVRPATLPSYPLRFQHGWAIWLLSCGVGLAAALAWVALSKLRGARHAGSGSGRRSRTSIPPRGSFPPNAKVFIPGQAAAAGGSGPPGSDPAPRHTTPGLDHLRALRDQLYLLAADSCLVVGVSSAVAESTAKSVVAGQLAWLLAESEQVEVLLLEADFDQPAVHLVMDVMMPPLAGFTQQIHRRLQSQVSGPWTVVRRAASLSVLAEGMLRTPGMMYSVQFSSAITELRGAYDIIVVSGPAVGVGAYARAFLDIIDGVVFVTDPHDKSDEPDRLATETFRGKRFVSLVPAPELEGG
jgi:Mrp family chromosome partitioning ATPase